MVVTALAGWLETWSHNDVAHTGLELLIFLPQPPRAWDTGMGLDHVIVLFCYYHFLVWRTLGINSRLTLFLFWKEEITSFCTRVWFFQGVSHIWVYTIYHPCRLFGNFLFTPTCPQWRIWIPLWCYLLSKLGLALINIFVLIIYSLTKGVTMWQPSSILYDIWRPENTVREMSEFGSVCLAWNLLNKDPHFLCFLFFFFSFLFFPGQKPKPKPGHPSQRQPGKVTILGCP